jgi:hypothetical protein
MRDYLYIWHNKDSKFIVSSGIEYRDVSSQISETSGIILLNHDSDDFEYDELSRFEFVPQDQLSVLTKEDIYSWGDFCWVDYNTETFPNIPKNEIAELLYFGHQGEPFGDIRIPSLKNKYLYYAHDDGWFLRLYYKKWDDIVQSIDSIEFSFDKKKLANLLSTSSNAYWISVGSFEEEKPTFDVDSVLNKRLR